MGATGSQQTSSTNGLEQHMLSTQELNSLRVNDRIDHRDYGGLFCAAYIKQKNGQNLQISYDHYPSKYDVWCDYNANPYLFAKYQTISCAPATNVMANMKVKDTVLINPIPERGNGQWVPAVIVEKSVNSGQVKVRFTDHSQSKPTRKWIHLDSKYEIKPVNTYERIETQPSHHNNTQQQTHKKWSCELYDGCILLPLEIKTAYNNNARIDFRCDNGLFVSATIKEIRNGTKLLISYKQKVNNNRTQKVSSWYDYTQNPYRFAEGDSISAKQSKLFPNIRVNDFILINPCPDSGNSAWTKGKIVSMDNHSGQVKVKYRNSNGQYSYLWTHLDNECEIRAHKTQRSHNKNVCSNDNGHNHGYPQYNTGNEQTQKQIYEQKKDQQQITARIQLLLDCTKATLDVTHDYLDGLKNDTNDKEMLSDLNSDATTRLTVFKMKVKGMRKNAKNENIDFDNGFKASSMMIKKFEQDMIGKFGNNKEIMSQLTAFLNYMRCVLGGQTKMPKLPHLTDYTFTKEVAATVTTGFMYAMNHSVPDRMKEIEDNAESYAFHHKELANEYDDVNQYNPDNENLNQVNVDRLTKDFHGNRQFAMSKKEQDAMNKRMHYEVAFQEPNLQDGW